MDLSASAGDLVKRDAASDLKSDEIVAPGVHLRGFVVADVPARRCDANDGAAAGAVVSLNGSPAPLQSGLFFLS